MVQSQLNQYQQFQPTSPTGEVRRTQALVSSGVVPVPVDAPGTQPKPSERKNNRERVSKEAAKGSEAKSAQSDITKRSDVVTMLAYAGYKDKEKRFGIRDKRNQENVFNPRPEIKPEKGFLGQLSDNVTGFVGSLFSKKKEPLFTPGVKTENSFFTDEDRDASEGFGRPDNITPKMAFTGDPLVKGIRSMNDYYANAMAARLNHEDKAYEADEEVMDLVSEYQDTLALPQFAGERMT